MGMTFNVTRCTGAVAVVLVAALGGCGGTKDLSSHVVSEPAEIVATTENLTARVRVVVRPPHRARSAARSGTAIQLDGVVDLSSHRFRLWRSDPGARRWWEMVGQGRRVYSRRGNDAWSFHGGSAGPELAHGFDLWTVLDELRDADELVPIASDDRRDATTDRYWFRSTSDGAVHEIWVDDQGRVVRIHTEPAASSDSRLVSIPGVENGPTTIELWEFGIPVDIALPTDAGPDR